MIMNVDLSVRLSQTIACKECLVHRVCHRGYATQPPTLSRCFINESKNEKSQRLNGYERQEVKV
jgi:hypothetical protein